MNAQHTPTLEIREATTADQTAIRRLAQLDSRPQPEGRTLLAAINGRIEAALAVDSGRAVADPFEPTAEAVDLLKIRAAQLRTA